MWEDFDIKETLGILSLRIPDKRYAMTTYGCKKYSSS